MHSSGGAQRRGDCGTTHRRNALGAGRFAQPRSQDAVDGVDGSHRQPRPRHPHHHRTQRADPTSFRPSSPASSGSSTTSSTWPAWKPVPVSAEVEWVQASDILEAARLQRHTSAGRRAWLRCAMNAADRLIQIDPRLTSAARRMSSKTQRPTPPPSTAHLASTSVSIRRPVADSVRDRGPGIPASGLERIFERFYRSNNAFRRSPLAAAGAGDHSRDGGDPGWADHGRESSRKAARFSRSGDSRAPAAARRALHPGTRMSATTILLVDDEPSIQLATATLLRSKGYEVPVAGTGGEAIAVFSIASAHVSSFSISSLPDMDGVVVCRQLRARADVPISDSVGARRRAQPRLRPSTPAPTTT